jgi:hypothetical protein
MDAGVSNKLIDIHFIFQNHPSLNHDHDFARAFDRDLRTKIGDTHQLRSFATMPLEMACLATGALTRYATHCF